MHTTGTRSTTQAPAAATRASHFGQSAGCCSEKVLRHTYAAHVWCLPAHNLLNVPFPFLNGPHLCHAHEGCNRPASTQGGARGVARIQKLVCPACGSSRHAGVRRGNDVRWRKGAVPIRCTVVCRVCNSLLGGSFARSWPTLAYGVEKRGVAPDAVLTQRHPRRRQRLAV